MAAAVASGREMPLNPEMRDPCIVIYSTKKAMETCPVLSIFPAATEDAHAQRAKISRLQLDPGQAGPVCSESGVATRRSTPPRLKYTGNP